MTMNPTLDAGLGHPRSDADDAAEFAFEFLEYLGLNTGDLDPADFRYIVSRLLKARNLRVRTEERLDRERDDASYFALENEDYARDVRERIKKLNGIRGGVDMLGESGSAARRASAEKLPPDLDDEIEP